MICGSHKPDYEISVWWDGMPRYLVHIYSFLQNISKFLTNHAITSPGTVIFTKVQRSKVQIISRTYTFLLRLYHLNIAASIPANELNPVFASAKLRSLTFKNNTYVFVIVPLFYLTSISCHFPFTTLKYCIMYYIPSVHNNIPVE